MFSDIENHLRSCRYQSEVQIFLVHSTIAADIVDVTMAVELFQSIIPNKAPADGHGAILTVGGVGFNQLYSYECRFKCETSQCFEYFFQNAKMVLVVSKAQYSSSSLLTCTIPLWPFGVFALNVSIW